MTAQLMRDTFAPRSFELDLMDVDRVVGWIVDGKVGFRGFEDATEATHAAWIAHRTLARRIARTHGMRLVPIDVEPLALKRSDTGETDVILASNRPIATLVRPGAHGRAGDSFGFELTVPSRMSEFEVRGVAYLMYRTLRKSGVRWAMWRASAPARTESVTAAAHATTATPLLEPVRYPRRNAGTLAGRSLRWLRDRWRLTNDALRRVSPLNSTTHTL